MLRKNNKLKPKTVHSEPLFNPLSGSRNDPSGLNPLKSQLAQRVESNPLRSQLNPIDIGNPINIGLEEIWDSGLTIVPLDIQYDYRLLSICNSIQARYENEEFSILVKGSWKNEGFFVTSDYFIPPQKVDRTSVDYKDDLTTYRKRGYNTVIHSHPFSSNNFSSADEEHINTHFDCSVLYSLGKFTTATISIQLDDSHKLKLPVSKIAPSLIHTEPIIGLENITRSTQIVPQSDYYHYPDRSDYAEYYKDTFKL